MPRLRYSVMWGGYWGCCLQSLLRAMQADRDDPAPACMNPVTAMSDLSGQNERSTPTATVVVLFSVFTGPMSVLIVSSSQIVNATPRLSLTAGVIR